mmetsp:Transcript_140523/g.365589  ORF Transcript_140523/g.365589 Transcript_140523/m.365589 type:complete len:272 (+) Transcript_140523:194-1009(+)
MFHGIGEGRTCRRPAAERCVRSAANKQRDNLQHALCGRFVQRRLLGGVGGLRVGAAVQQRLRPGDLALLGGLPELPGEDRGVGQRGPAAEEEADDGGVATVDCYHDGRPVAIHALHLLVSVFVQERPGDLDVTLCSSLPQWRFAEAIARVEVGADCDERGHQLGVSLLCRIEQIFFQLVPVLLGDALLDEQPGDLEALLLDGDHQRRAPVLPFLFSARLVHEQHLRHLEITSSDGLQQLVSQRLPVSIPHSSALVEQQLNNCQLPICGSTG